MADATSDFFRLPPRIRNAILLEAIYAIESLGSWLPDGWLGEHGGEIEAVLDSPIAEWADKLAILQLQILPSPRPPSNVKFKRLWRAAMERPAAL